MPQVNGFQNPGLGFSRVGGGLAGFQRQGMDQRKKAANSFVALPAVTTWNPADQLNTTLSQGNLRGDSQQLGSSRTARATIPRTEGRLYFEVNFIGYAFGSMAGLTLGSTALSATLAATLGLAYTMHTGYQRNGADTAMDLGVSTAAPHGLAWDLDRQLAWFINFGSAAQWNNNALADPSAGIGGISFAAVAAVGTALYPAMSTFGDVGQTEAVLANFGATQFYRGLPDGFAAWNGF